MEFRPVFPPFGKIRDHFSNPWDSNRQSSIVNRQSRSGLTLVEVMLAIVILGIGSGILLVAVSRCMAVATKAKHYSHAHSLLLRVDAENPITRNRDEIEEGKDSGSFDDGYSWEREITESEEDGREGLYTVRTRVSWSARGKTSFEETTRYLYIRPNEEELRDAQQRRSR